jgi:hypothetical protein
MFRDLHARPHPPVERVAEASVGEGPGDEESGEGGVVVCFEPEGLDELEEVELDILVDRHRETQAGRVNTRSQREDNTRKNEERD